MIFCHNCPALVEMCIFFSARPPSDVSTTGSWPDSLRSLPKMLTSSAPEGPYHSVRILTSFGFEQTGDNEKYPLDLMRRVLS